MMKMHDRVNVGKLIIKPEQIPKPKVVGGANLSFNTTVNVMKYLGVFSNSSGTNQGEQQQTSTETEENGGKDMDDINDE